MRFLLTATHGPKREIWGKCRLLLISVNDRSLRELNLLSVFPKTEESIVELGRFLFGFQFKVSVLLLKSASSVVLLIISFHPLQKDVVDCIQENYKWLFSYIFLIFSINDATHCFESINNNSLLVGKLIPVIPEILEQVSDSFHCEVNHLEALQVCECFLYLFQDSSSIELIWFLRCLKNNIRWGDNIPIFVSDGGDTGSLFFLNLPVNGVIVEFLGYFLRIFGSFLLKRGDWCCIVWLSLCSFRFFIVFCVMNGLFV